MLNLQQRKDRGVIHLLWALTVDTGARSTLLRVIVSSSTPWSGIWVTEPKSPAGRYRGRDLASVMSDS